MGRIIFLILVLVAALIGGCVDEKNSTPLGPIVADGEVEITPDAGMVKPDAKMTTDSSVQPDGFQSKVCGNGVCESTLYYKEDCNNCAKDCGKCPDAGNTSYVQIKIQAPALAECHLYYGGGYDTYKMTSSISPYTATYKLVKSEVCKWGVEVHCRVPVGSLPNTWPWYGDNKSVPSMNQVVVLVDGKLVFGVLKVHPWTNAEGNLYISLTQLGCYGGDAGVFYPDAGTNG